MNTNRQPNLTDSSAYLRDKMVSARLKPTGCGRIVPSVLSPHPSLLPRGIGGVASVAVESSGHQSGRRSFHRHWERSSLSPRPFARGSGRIARPRFGWPTGRMRGVGRKTRPAERARMRGNDASFTPKIVLITRSAHTVHLRCISTHYKFQRTIVVAPVEAAIFIGVHSC